MGRRRLFFRVVYKAFRVQPGRMAASFAALAVGATLASAFLNLYFDLPRKMTTEFRTLGANLILAPKGTSETLPEEVYRELAEAQPATPRLPWLYAVGKVNGQEAILAGTEFERLAMLNPGWQVYEDPAERRAATPVGDFVAQAPQGMPGPEAKWLLAGETAAAHFGWKAGETATVEYGSATLELKVIGIVSTGGSEDSQLLLPLPVLQEVTGRAGQLSLIALAAPGAAAQVEALRQQLAGRWPEIDVRPLRPVLESEARVILKVRGLMFGLTAIVLAIVILSVMTTVSGLVLDRQRDIGVMKSLGGSDRAISLLFVAETLSIAAVAALLGYAVGLGLAQWAAERIFAAPLPWRWDTLPAVVGVTLAVAFLAAMLPVYRVRRLDPAVVLRGN
ncbi:MAG: ABC transporter permease [Terriglobia bacterium]